jgi:predicted permease
LLVSLGPSIPRIEEVSISWRVLVFAALAGVVTGTIFGVAPVASVARRSLKDAMVGGLRGTTSAARSFQGKVVSLQIAISAILLVVGGLFGRSFLALIEVDPGFETANLAVLSVNAPVSRYQTDADATNLFLEAVHQLEAVPGVISVSASQGLPFPGYAHLNGARIVALGEDGWFVARRRSILPDYHETMGIPLIAGRFLSNGGDADQSREMVISQALAESRWPAQSPIGALVSFWREDWTVVGVVADVKHTSLRTAGEPTFYVPLSQTPQRDLAIVVRFEGDVTPRIPELRDAIWSVDADLPIEDARTMKQLIALSAATDRHRAALVICFAALATLIAGAGVFGLTSHMVAQRSREIGIRSALGAQQLDLLGMVMRNGLSYALVGSGIGLLAAVGGSHLISAYLFGVELWDPLTYLCVVGLLSLLACAASYLPARRATDVDPLVALRAE